MRFVSNAFAFFVLPVAAVWIASWGVGGINRGNAPSGMVALLGAVTFVVFAAGWAVMRFWPRSRGYFGATGTTIRPRKLYDTLSYTWHIAATLAGWVYISFAPFGLIDIPHARSTQPWLMAVAALAGAATVWRMLAHGGDSYLKLTQEGCEIWNGPWLAMRRAKWEDISEVRDQPLHRKLRGREVIVLAQPEGRSGTLLSDTVTANSDALREWVRFYWRHPEHRAELTDGRALRRLGEENLNTE